MECDRAREAISAILDGEEPGCDPQELERHLAGCPDCAGWRERAHGLTRRMRLGLPEPGGERRDQLLAALRAGGEPGSGRVGGRPTPFDKGFWRSPLRGPWLTSALGFVLLIGLPLVMLTGLLSNDAYDPRVGGNVALQGRTLGPLDFYLFTWPAHPAWLYALNQGIHISVGLGLIPVVIAKQWSVLPRLFAWPPVRSVRHAVERISLLFLVGGIFFEIVTGILFIEYWFPFHFDFTQAHYYGAWVFFGAFLLHAAVKLPTMRSALATRRAALAPLHTDLAGTRPEPPDWAVESLVPVAPAAPTMSRRTLLGTVGAGSLLLLIQGIAQDVGGPLRRLALMMPRSSTLGAGPNDFPINGTFASLGLSMDTIEKWRLTVKSDSGRTISLTREELMGMPLHSYSLPISCREGWSTTQRWTGVRLRDLAARVGVEDPSEVDLGALDGATAALAANQITAEEALLALNVNGVPLSLDHGFPARVIVPAEIAVNCLKWVDSLAFQAAAPSPHHPPGQMPVMGA